MDTIATALSYCFDDQEYSRLSNISSEDSLGHDQHQYYASHDQVVDVLLHREESNMSETDLYMINDESNFSEADCYIMDPNTNQYYLTESSQEVIPKPPVTTAFHQDIMVQCDDLWRPESRRNSKEKPTHNILLQRTHTKRSKVGAATKRFEDKTKHEQYKKAACERERARMKDCNKIFAQLRAGLPMTKASGKRVSKIETLRMAIRYIKHLRTVLSYPPGSHIPQHVLTFNPANDDSEYIQY